jgi:hypothetical protein
MAALVSADSPMITGYRAAMPVRVSWSPYDLTA